LPLFLDDDQNIKGGSAVKKTAASASLFGIEKKKPVALLRK
jgi:hypothetical protein